MKSRITNDAVRFRRLEIRCRVRLTIRDKDRVRICLGFVLDRMNIAELLYSHKNFVILEDQVEDQPDITHI